MGYKLWWMEFVDEKLALFLWSEKNGGLGKMGCCENHLVLECTYRRHGCELFGAKENYIGGTDLCLTSSMTLKRVFITILSSSRRAALSSTSV